MLEARELRKSFGAIRAVDGASLASVSLPENATVSTSCISV